MWGVEAAGRNLAAGESPHGDCSLCSPGAGRAAGAAAPAGPPPHAQRPCARTLMRRRTAALLGCMPTATMTSASGAPTWRGTGRLGNTQCGGARAEGRRGCRRGQARVRDEVRLAAGQARRGPGPSCLRPCPSSPAALPGPAGLAGPAGAPRQGPPPAARTSWSRGSVADGASPAMASNESASSLVAACGWFGGCVCGWAGGRAGGGERASLGRCLVGGRQRSGHHASGRQARQGRNAGGSSSSGSSSSGSSSSKRRSVRRTRARRQRLGGLERLRQPLLAVHEPGDLLRQAPLRGVGHVVGGLRGAGEAGGAVPARVRRLSGSRCAALGAESEACRAGGTGGAGSTCQCWERRGRQGGKPRARPWRGLGAGRWPSGASSRG